MVIRVPDQRNTPGGYAALDDRLLVLDFQAGNPQAFVEIHRRYGGLARHVCQRFLPIQQDADEAFQETMIRVFQGLYRFNGRYALQPWVARIAKNVSLDHLRGRARRPQAQDAPASDELPMPGDEADEIVERLVQRDIVLSVLSDLPETHRRALMLRELEGRSHREVAQEMEISTSQAKALIHRAKGSFRRRWLEKVAERGGFMGIAFVPLLWLARIGYGMRRIGDRLGHAAQAAQAASPETLTSTVSATSAPVVTTGVGERLVAAGMTLLLAGGVTVGAAKIVNDRTEDEAAGRVVAEAIESNDPSAESKQADQAVDDRLTPPAPKDLIEAEPPEQVEPSPSPAVEPVIEPAPEPEPEPTETPPPDPTPPPVALPPAPPWSLILDSSVPLGSFEFHQISSRVIGNPEKSFAFSQAVEGLPTSESPLVQRVYLEVVGSREEDRGSVNVLFLVDTAAGRYRYDALCSINSVVLSADGGFSYLFAGNYSRTEGPIGDEVVPTSGTASVELRFWPDGTLYETDLSLVEQQSN